MSNNPLDTELQTDELIKPFWLSKRYMGIAATIIQGLILTFFGVELDPKETAQLTMVLLGAGTTLTGAIALYGTIVAKHKIVLKKPKK